MVDYHFMVFLSNFMLSWNRLLSAYAAAWTRLGLRPRRLVQSRKAHLCRWAFTDACRGELFYSFGKKNLKPLCGLRLRFF